MDSTLNAPVDVAADFFERDNFVFVAKRLTSFNPATGKGSVVWDRHRWKIHYAFNNMAPGLDPIGGNEFPSNEYEVNPTLPFSVQFVSPRTVRIRMATSATGIPDENLREKPLSPMPLSPMLVREPNVDASWEMKRTEKAYVYSNKFGSITIGEDPWTIEVRDSTGRVLTSTRGQANGLPSSFVRRNRDFARSIAATFSLAPSEKIMGLGEWFGPLDKRGQRLDLWCSDVISAERPLMYKPVPFFLSDRGYGMFIHTSAPIAADVGAKYFSNNTLMIGDDELDLFIFLGNPKEILDEYTDLTGKSAMPPLWSFGLWMSRITYKSEEETRTVAKKLRENKVPADVIHLDTGWFPTDWRCDYQFASERFENPQKMIDDLKGDGFRISLWQLPYFVPKNELFAEIVNKGLAVRDPKGGLPTEDAILDFSNPQTVSWFQEKLSHLLRLGIGAIKVDFGEAAPVNGIYASGRSGHYEHNLYPLRYQQTVADITKRVTGESIIWARAGWAGSQRYPLHWGGDSHGCDGAMAGTLRAGLSLGTCGFSFWSHDIGGFFGRPTAELYRRWAAFGLLTSHSRCHGDPPREPWEYGEAFQDDFRRTVEMKYRLMPYIYAQAKESSDRGLPMLRALYIEFPDDPGSWRVEDQYLLGSSLLVAPLLEADTNARNVYLPPGEWIDYQSSQRYAGGTWHKIEAGAVPAVVLVRAGSVIPHVPVAQSTAFIDWKQIEFVVYPSREGTASGQVFVPGDDKITAITASIGKDGLCEIEPKPATTRVVQSG